MIGEQNEEEIDKIPMNLMPEGVKFLGSEKIPLNKEQIEFLMKATGYPKKVERIFRASPNFSVAEFH